MKSVPLSLLERAARFGIGMSPVFEVFVVDDTITSSDEVSGPVGDLRLMPDPGALKVLAAQPGWAWAPVDKHTQEGQLYAGCQRTFAKRMVRAAADRGIEVRMAFELEWFQAGAGSEIEDPVHTGPAYGFPADWRTACSNCAIWLVQGPACADVAPASGADVEMRIDWPFLLQGTCRLSESRAGAVADRSGAVHALFAGAAVPRPCSVSSPRSSIRACRFPAPGFPRSFISPLSAPPCTT